MTNPKPAELPVRLFTGGAAFNQVVVPAIAAHLRAGGVPVDSTIAPLPKRAIPMDTVVKRAVRFFYPDILDATGIHTHVCTQLNAIRELPERDYD